jgi:hypothetical protein
VTPEEIREQLARFDRDQSRSGPRMRGYYFKIAMLAEIAAQFAEQNQQIREDRETRRLITEENRSERKKQDELFASSNAGIEALRKSVESPPTAGIPVAGVAPEHIGCFVIMPDNSYALVTRDGAFIPLEPDESKRLVALLQKPSAGKPQ